MTEPHWKPSAPLATATLAALAALSRQWPRAMALALEASEAGQEYLADFAAAMRGVDLRAIPMAAREWVAREKFAPKPAELGALARELSRQHFPPVFAPSQQASTENGILADARPFWVERVHPDDGPYQAQCWALASGGSAGVSEVEMDRIQARTLLWGWGVAHQRRAA